MNNMNEFLGAVPPTKQETCPTHGAYESRNVWKHIWTKCPACEQIQAAEEARKKEEKAREEKRLRWQRTIGEAGIPKRFEDRTLDSFIAKNDGQKKALQFAREYAEDFQKVASEGRSAVFIGLPGTGKTHLAIGIGLSAMRDGYIVLFTTVMRAIRRVKDTWSRGSEESESDAIRSLIYPDLLILDEVGIQFGSETEKMILFDVLNGRYERRKPSLLISNLSLDEVRSFLGERVFDRLREDGGEVVAFTWESHRGCKPIGSVGND